MDSVACYVSVSFSFLLVSSLPMASSRGGECKGCDCYYICIYLLLALAL
jgi:hypothetical protein